MQLLLRRIGVRHVWLVAHPSSTARVLGRRCRRPLLDICCATGGSACWAEVTLRPGAWCMAVLRSSAC